MDLSNVIVVLSHPKEARNVGSVCRAMANFGTSRLRIVGQKSDYDVEVVERLAIHAVNIFEEAQYFSSVKAATGDCILSAGTTRRQGKKRKGRLYLPEELAKRLSRFYPPEDSSVSSSENSASDVDETKESESSSSFNPLPAVEKKALSPCESKGRFARGKPLAAVVFGNERTGLTDEDMDECSIAVRIPSSKVFPSLNLSHAVSIMLYTLYRTSSAFTRSYTPLTLAEISDVAECIVENLEAIGFFRLAGREEMKNSSENLLSRAEISAGERDYIKRLFTKISALVKKNSEK